MFSSLCSSFKLDPNLWLCSLQYKQQIVVSRSYDTGLQRWGPHEYLHCCVIPFFECGGPWALGLALDQEDVEKWCCMTFKARLREILQLLLGSLGLLTQGKARCDYHLETMKLRGSTSYPHWQTVETEREESQPPAIPAIPAEVPIVWVKNHFRCPAHLCLLLTLAPTAVSL